ncbi:MAG: hypothetical protein RIR49_5 [Actinomycetota bacterium]
MTRTLRTLTAVGGTVMLLAACGGTDEAADVRTTDAPAAAEAAADASSDPVADMGAVRDVLGDGDPETASMLAGLSDGDIACLLDEAGLDPDTLDASMMADEDTTTALGLGLLRCAPDVVAEAMAAEMGVTVEQASCLLSEDGAFMQLVLADDSDEMTDEESFEVLGELFQAMADCGIDMGDMSDMDDGSLTDLGGLEPGQLRAECEAGDMDSCDSLFYSSETGSDDEDFGATCGGTTDGSTAGMCGYEAPTEAELEALADGCLSGDMAACDDLYFSSEFGSELEEIAATCGGTADGSTAGMCSSGS